MASAKMATGAPSVRPKASKNASRKGEATGTQIQNLRRCLHLGKLCHRGFRNLIRGEKEPAGRVASVTESLRFKGKKTPLSPNGQRCRLSRPPTQQ